MGKVVSADRSLSTSPDGVKGFLKIVIVPRFSKFCAP